MNSAWSPPPDMVSLRAATAALPSARVFLFLQGLPGPFFRRLGRALRDAGATVHRVNFCGGDVIDWPGGIAWRRPLAAWPDGLGSLITRLGVTDVVLFGDSRPVHVAARAVASAQGVTVHCFEEGYLRPDFVTLEAGGVNGHSRLPRDLAAIGALAAVLPEVPVLPPLAGNFGRRARESIRHYLAALLLRPAFPWFRGHRPVGPVTEAIGWLRRLARRSAEARRTAATMATLTGQPYMVLPLQLDSDSQLTVHSRFGGMTAALAAVIDSFAAHAPPALRLLVKQHPLDPALADWGAITARLAAAAGVDDRVAFIEAGDINAILAGARGVVTVNSTTGTLALAAGIPVKVLGTAVYDVPGLTSSAALAAFWGAPGSVDAGAYAALRRVLVHHSLIHGGFHCDAGLARLVAGACQRLLAAP